MRIRFEPRTPDGTQVNAVYGFCNMLWKLLKEMKPDERPTHLAVVFDKSEKTFRTEMYKEYKAHRPPRPMTSFRSSLSFATRCAPSRFLASSRQGTRRTT